MDDDVRIEWLLTRLMHSLQALAAPADVQLGLFPDFVCKIDELAQDFENWRLSVIDNSQEAGLTEPQQASLNALDDRMTAVWRVENGLLWTEEALRSRPEWEEVRQMAVEALATFGWPVEIPPSYGHEYIGGARPRVD